MALRPHLSRLGEMAERHFAVHPPDATRARALLDRLEAAILARAFRGELVPQDPADEPAAALLDRIRARRTADTATKRKRRAPAAAQP